MQPTNFFREKTLTALAAASLLALTALAGLGCGQDVASCATVCASDTSGNCQNSCDDAESNCTAVSASGDFQALLTCIGNAGGSYDDVPPLCQSEQDTVNSSCAQNIER